MSVFISKIAVKDINPVNHKYVLLRHFIEEPLTCTCLCLCNKINFVTYVFVKLESVTITKTLTKIVNWA